MPARRATECHGCSVGAVGDPADDAHRGSLPGEPHSDGPAEAASGAGPDWTVEVDA